MAIILTKINEVFFLGEPESISDTIELQELHIEFEYIDPEYKYDKTFKMGAWDGRVRFIRYVDKNRDKILVPIGLIKDVRDFCKRRNIEIRFTNDDFGIKDYSKYIEKLDSYIEKVLDLPNTIEIRPYQIDYIKIALRLQRSVMVSSTGSGKSFMLYTIIRWLLHHEFKKNEKILLIVPSTILVEQMEGDFRSYGYKEDNIEKIYYGQEKNFKKQIIISTWQSLYKNDIEFFEQFSGVICDECHKAQADKINYILENCINARFRLGTTATLYTDKLKRYQIMSFLGYPYKLKTTNELIDEGYLSPFIVNNIVLKWRTKEKLNLKPENEIEEIISNENRFKMITNFIKHVYNEEKKGTYLVLASRIDYIKKIYDELKKNNENVYAIYGEIKEEERQKILSVIKNNGGILVANTSIMGTGVNIPNITNIFITTPFKSVDILTPQVIGRSIRLHPDKKIANIFDFFDKIPVTERRYNTVFSWIESKCSFYKREKSIFKNYLYEFDAF